MSAKPSASEAEERRRERRAARTALAAAALISAFHFAGFDVVRQAIVTDARYYLYFAWRLAEGVPPHVSGFDPKTQLATFAGAGLYRLGAAVGVDPLVAIRAGWLAFAALGALLAFVVHRRLGRGDALFGALGLLAYTAFGLIGALAAVGNAPKLLTALAATAMALAVHRRRWGAAGAASALAFLDWQIGGQAGLVAFASALAFGGAGRERWRAALRAVGGGVLVLVPYALYFALHGQLAEAFRQTVVAALARGEAFVGERTFVQHLEHVLHRMEVATGPQLGLFFASAGGVAVAALRLWQWRRDDRLRLLAPLCAMHLGIAAFSAVDFQGRGDASIVLHGSAFFLALLGAWLVERARALVGRPRVVAAAALVLAVAVARPGPLRPELPIGTAIVRRNVTLQDQREVAAQLADLTRDRTLLVLQHSELLFLMRYANPGPAIYWNSAVVDHLAREGEGEAELLGRLIEEAGADALLFFSPRNPGRLAGAWERRTLESENGEYVVRVELAR